MDTALWVLQVLLALGFVGAGLNHVMRRDRASGRMVWMLAVPKPLMTTIGILELAGAAGLVLPPVTGVALWLRRCSPCSWCSRPCSTCAETAKA